MMWFLMFFKRNFKHFSFILILILLPVFTLFMKNVTRTDDSIMKIGYTSRGEGDQMLMSVFSEIESDDSVIEFIKYPSEKMGQKALDGAEIDSLWIFEGEFSSALKSYFEGKKGGIVTVLMREEGEIYEITLEKLFCFIYPHVSYSLFKDYMTELDESLSEEELLKYYNYKGMDSEIVEIKTVDFSGKVSENEISFLMSAIKGILSLLVLLSALAAALFVKEDIERGLFLLMTPLKQLLLSFAAIMSALIPTGAVFLLCVKISGVYSGFAKELLSLVLLVFTSAAFSLFLLTILKTKKALCVAFPLTLTAAAVFSPIFLNVKAFPVIQALFPTYHYLYSFTNPDEYAFSLIYAFAFFTITFFTVAKDKNMLTIRK